MQAPLDTHAQRPVGENMHVLIVDTWQHWGGGERYVVQLAHGLSARGMRVSVAGANERLLQQARDMRVPALRVPIVIRHRTALHLLLVLLLSPALVLQYLWLLRRFRAAGEVHITTLEDQLLLTPLARLARRRVSWSIHGPLRLGRNPVYRALFSFAARRTHAVIAVSQTVERSLVEHGVPPDRTLVIPHGVAGRNVLPPPARSTPRVGFVGRLEEEKDPLLFCQVAARARSLGADARFVIYGDGSLRPVVADVVDKLGLTGHVELAGHVNRPDEIFGSLDALVLTSRVEGFGLVLIEAGAAGVPVVAVDLPAVREVVRDGVTGVIVSRDPDQLARAVVALAADEVARARLGEAARRHVAARFSADAMLDRTASVLRG